MGRLSSDRLALLRATLAARGLEAPRTGAIPRRADRRRAPLSLSQERLHFLELYQPGTALHNDTLHLAFPAALDHARLAAALGRIQERHEILRTSFALAGDGPEQRVHEPGPAALRYVDLAGERDAAGLARSLAFEDARAPFDLERPGQWRATLARVDERRSVLSLTMHHILSDGASMGLLLDELAALYADPEAALAPLPVQFGDYAAWERARLDPRREDELAGWWKEELQGLEDCEWPGRGAQGTGLGAQVPLEFAPACAARLAALARAEQVTTNQLLLAVWFALLGARSGASDICTGIASSLRRRPELRALLGFFVQSLPLRVDLDGDPTLLALARRVRARALGALEHGDLPFDRIARAAGRTGGGAAGPALFSSFFSHMKDAIREPVLAGVRGSWEFVDPGTARFELTLVLHESEHGLAGFLEYDLGCLAPAAAERLAGDYVRLLEAVLARPETRLSELRALCTPALRREGRTLTLPPRLRRAVGE